MKITIEIDAPGSDRISAKVVADILHEITRYASKHGSEPFCELTYRLHIMAVYTHDAQHGGRVSGEMFLEAPPPDTESEK